MKQAFAAWSVVTLLSMSAAVAQEDPGAALPEDTLAPEEELGSEDELAPEDPGAPADQPAPMADDGAPAGEAGSGAGAAAAPAEEPGAGAGGAAPGALADGPTELRPYLGGLTGYGRIITTGVLSGDMGDEELKLGVRANFLFQHAERNFSSSFPGATARAEVRAQRYVFQAAVGFLEMAEVSLSLPIIDYEASSNFGSIDQDAGFGNPELGLKFRLPIENDLVSVAAYTRVELPWGEHGVFDPERFPLEEGKFAEWELGGIVGVNAGIVSGTVQLGYRLIETGIQTFVYRFGVAARPVEAFELGIYYAGEEFEGAPESDGVFGATATAFFEPVFFQLGVDGLIVDGASDYVAGRRGGDGGGWSIYWSVGAAF